MLSYLYNIGQPFINLYTPWSDEITFEFPSEYKEDITEALVASGESHRVYKVLSDIERNREDYLHFYEEGVKVGEGCGQTTTF